LGAHAARSQSKRAQAVADGLVKQEDESSQRQVSPQGRGLVLCAHLARLLPEPFPRPLQALDFTPTTTAADRSGDTR
jgi:hypothetical protein